MKINLNLLVDIITSVGCLVKGRTITAKQLFIIIAMMAFIGTASYGEVIGEWNILSAPISATFQTGNPRSVIKWTNVNNANISISDAFSEMSVIDDGLGNLPNNSTITMTFSPRTALNIPGVDLVLFEAFDEGSYSMSTDYDNFSSSLIIGPSQFLFTGIENEYYYGLNWGPFLTPVRGAPVNLSQLGIPLGQSVNEIRLVVITSGSDPLGIGSLSIPEPATLFLVAFGFLFEIKRRRI